LEYVLVKEYGRPAAGRIIKSNDLRGLDVLRKTTEYLVDEYQIIFLFSHNQIE